MGTKRIFFTSGSGTFTIPDDFGRLLNLEAIGGGAAGVGGGGSAGWYVSNTLLGLVPGQSTYYSIGAGGDGTAEGGPASKGGETWFNVKTNAPPTDASEGVLAKGGNIGVYGSSLYFGGVCNTPGCIPLANAFPGGSGGNCNNTSSTFLGGGGGGGASCPSGWPGQGNYYIHGGGNGGFGESARAGGGGGGDGGGDGYSGSSLSGGNGAYGGLEWPGIIFEGSFQGQGATETTAATAGVNGSGGGGGFYGGTSTAAEHVGGNGSTQRTYLGSIYPDLSGTGTYLGCGSGGGGGIWVVGTGTWKGGDGGLYGGGGGGVGNTTSPQGNGGSGLFIFTYATKVHVGNAVVLPGQIKFT